MTRSTGDMAPEPGRAEARVRAAVQAVVRREEARVGFLFDGAGMVHAAGGNPGSLEPTTFVPLVFAQFEAARDLAPVATGGDLLQLAQEGGQSRCILSALPDDRTLALLYDDVGASEDRVELPARAVRRTPDLSEVSEATRALSLARAAGGSRSDRALAKDWTSEAEGQIDRIFRGED